MPQAYSEALNQNGKQNLHAEMENSGEDQRKIEYGYCKCGCGKKTWISNVTHKKRKWIKNQPVNFFTGHHFRMKKYCDENHHGWKGNKVGYAGVHSWIAKKLGRPRICWECGDTKGKSRKYHWANISGKYLREIKDWKRLCAKCHAQFDEHGLKVKCELNSQAKLIRNEVIKIRELYKTKKYTQLNLSKKFEISRGNISDIVNYKTWKF